MIEVAIFVQPLLSSLLVSGINHGTIDDLQVLSLALGPNELVRFLEYGLIVLQEAQPVPSLLDFGIQGFGEVVVVVDAFHDGGVNLAPILPQLVKEYELILGIVVLECLEVVRRARALEILVLLRK